MARWYDTPPAELPGRVVIYKDPLSYRPRSLSVKRVIAVGGQLLQVLNETEGLSSSSSSPRRSTTTAVVPPYFLHVEGTKRNEAPRWRWFKGRISSCSLLSDLPCRL